MKRTPLTRRTPLQTRTGLARGAGLKRSTKPLPAKGGTPEQQLEKRRRREAAQAAEQDARYDGHSILWAEVRRILWVRSGGHCEVCGRVMRFASMEAHHRRTRRVGPDCPCNALALCHDCHHVKVHAQPEKSRELGRIISRHDRNACTIQSVRLRYGVVYLSCDGGLTPAGQGSTIDP